VGVRRHVFAAAALTLSLLVPSTARADQKITIMVGGIEKQIYLPAKLTEQLGYFKDEGLNVEVLTEPAGVQAEDEIVSGAIDGVVGFYDHTLDLQAKGKFLESVVQFSQVPGEVELVSTKHGKSINSPADFKGKTLGVTGLGSSTAFLTQYIVVKAGLKAGDYSLLGVEAGNTFIAAMQQGKIDAGMTTEPTVSRLLHTGEARVLIDLRTAGDTKRVLGGLYPAASLYMNTSWVNTHREQTQKLANAFVRTMRWIATHSAAQIADKMPADYYAGDKDSYVKALAAGKGMWTPDGMMPESGPRTVFAVLSSFNNSVRGKSIDLSRTYTDEFVKAANKKFASK
jgi:NitT/TauT family transport system substrate-binding protein